MRGTVGHRLHHAAHFVRQEARLGARVGSAIVLLPNSRGVVGDDSVLSTSSDTSAANPEAAHGVADEHEHRLVNWSKLTEPVPNSQPSPINATIRHINHGQRD